jgi:C4-dicarboxylate-specific signal transduction histidine kinase
MLAHRKFKIGILIVQLISILPFLIFIFYLSDLWYEQRRDTIIEKNAVQAKQIGEIVSRSIQIGDILSSSLAYNPYFFGEPSANTGVFQKTLKKIVSDFPEIHNIIILNTEGEPVISDFDLTPDQKRENASDRPYFQKVLQTKKTVVSEPLEGRITGANLVILSSPVIINDKITAIINISYNLDNLKQNIEKTLTQNVPQSIFVLDSNKKVVFMPNKPLPDDKEKEAFLPLSLVPEMGKTVSIDNQKMPLFQGIAIGASYTLSDTGWTILSVQPISEAFAPLFIIQNSIWIIIIVSFLFALLVISYFLRKAKIIL